MHSEFKDFVSYDIPQVTDESLDNYLPVVILLREADYATHESLLLKILGAMDLDVSKQVSFIKLSPKGFFNTGKLPKTTEHILAFGLKPSDLGFNSAFKGYRFYKTETFSILFSHPLAKLSAEKQKKKSLWEALQSEFKLG